MNSMKSRLVELFRSQEISGIAGAAVVKVVGAGSMFFLFLLAARVLDPETFGHFAITFSVSAMLAVFAAFGQEIMIIRLWNQYGADGKYALMKGSIIFGFVACVIGGSVAGLAYSGFVLWSGDAALAGVIGFYILAYTLILFLSHLCRAVVNVLVGDGHREFTATILLNLFLAGCLFFGWATSLEAIFTMHLAGMVMAMLFHCRSMIKTIRTQEFGQFKERAEYDLKNWMPPSLRLWFATLLESSNQYLEVVLIGFLMSPTAAGIYFVATRLANVFAMVADALNMFGSKHIPYLFYRDEHAELASLLRMIAIITILVICGGLLVFIFGGELVLSLFNEEYASYSDVLLILCIGTAALAATGPATQMLMLTGHEGRYLQVIGVSVFLRITGFFFLIPLFGIYGAAGTTATSLFVMALLVGITVKRRTGHDASVFRLLSATSRPFTKPAAVS